MAKSRKKMILWTSALVAVIAIAASVLAKDGFAPVSVASSVSGVPITTDGNHVLTFTHHDPDFSLQYPDTLQATSSKGDDGSETIIFSGPEQPDAAGHMGFQIFVSQYSGSAPIDGQFVHDAFPSLAVNDPVQIVFGDGVPGLVFMSMDETIGKTRELWFARGGYLYQVTTYADLDGWLAGIFKTWRQ